MEIDAVIDTSRLNRGLELAMLYTRRTPAQCVNTAAREVAIVAKNTMPHATTEEIDANLGTMAIPIIGRSGRVLSQKYAKNKIQHGTRMGDKKEVPLTVLIMVARAKPGSNYNLKTNNRYALDRNPFKGFSRELGRQKMAALIDAMIKNRHRSTHFLMAGWMPAVKTLRPLSVNKWRKQSSIGPPLEGMDFYYGKELGEAIPAMEGATTVTCTISNLVGMEGVNGMNFNRALWELGAPVLQAAMDDEGTKQLAYFLSKSSKEELFDPINRLWG